MPIPHASPYDVQRALLDRGFDIGKAGVDGRIGGETLDGMMAALAKLPLAHAVPVNPVPVSLLQTVPGNWMPPCHMLRIIVHWTGGGHVPNAKDKAHYHILIDGAGALVRGDHSIDDNMNTGDGDYAAHTLGLNKQSIAVPLCGMLGAQESPFKPGPQPINQTQWSVLPHVLADLCRHYTIPVTRETVLSHAEVQATLGVKQKNKWDIARLPWDLSIVGARAIGDQFRAATRALL